MDRPIFASALPTVCLMIGILAASKLPVTPNPLIVPVVRVTYTYPGASAQVVAQTLAVPIESQVSEVEDILYMSSQCTNDGTYNLTVTFRPGVDPAIARQS